MSAASMNTAQHFSIGPKLTTDRHLHRYNPHNIQKSLRTGENIHSYVPRYPQAQNNDPSPQRWHQGPIPLGLDFDGKRLRRAIARKTVDYNSSIIEHLESRLWQRDSQDQRFIQPDIGYYTKLLPPASMLDNPMNATCTRFVRTSTNKMRCPIFTLSWTPEGRRLVTGASSGEFTLWNGLTFNFETILQAHDASVRSMVWSHNDTWMITGDHAGYVKYWQSNMNNVKMFQGHKDPVRGISFCPTDSKFVTCSDDGTVRIWDFARCFEEHILRGHGADVKCVDWHPQKALIVSGSKDSQQPIKLWDPKSGQALCTIHAHKSTVMEAKWNRNGNWLVTASRDHLLKLFDIRKLNQELQTFRGHKKEATSLAWHPQHESMFVSGGSDGAVMFWMVGAEKEVGAMEHAHDSCVWALAWHPLGHILATGSNDHTSKFWTRNRPGDKMRDRYNLNTLPRGVEDNEYDDVSTGIPIIPGMGLEQGTMELVQAVQDLRDEKGAIPGLDADEKTKKPFQKPIPRQFEQAWMEQKVIVLTDPNAGAPGIDHFVADAVQKGQVILPNGEMGGMGPPMGPGPFGPGDPMGFMDPRMMAGAPIQMPMGLDPMGMHMANMMMPGGPGMMGPPMGMLRPPDMSGGPPGHMVGPNMQQGGPNMPQGGPNMQQGGSNMQRGGPHAQQGGGSGGGGPNMQQGGGPNDSQAGPNMHDGASGMYDQGEMNYEGYPDGSQAEMQQQAQYDESQQGEYAMGPPQRGGYGPQYGRGGPRMGGPRPAFNQGPPGAGGWNEGEDQWNRYGAPGGQNQGGGRGGWQRGGGWGHPGARGGYQNGGGNQYGNYDQQHPGGGPWRGGGRGGRGRGRPY